MIGLLVPASDLRVGDRLRAGAGSYEEWLNIQRVETLDDGRIRYHAKCRGSNGKVTSWTDYPDHLLEIAR